MKQFDCIKIKSKTKETIANKEFSQEKFNRRKKNPLKYI